jgi:hypothetical protein
MKLALLCSTSASLLAVLSLAGCAATTSEDDVASGAGAQTEDVVRAGSRFDLNDGYVSGSLTVSASSATSLSFSISLVQDHMPHNMGDLEGVAKGENGKFKYTDEDCEIDFTVTKDTIEAKQNVDKGICGMGHNVFVDGSFRRWAGLKDKLVSGHYDNLAIAVSNGYVTGSLRDSIGDPSQGGATCEFTIAGKLGADQRQTKVIVTDAYDTYEGTLMIRDADSIALSVPTLPNACSRMLQEDEFKKAEGYAFKWGGLADPERQGYRTVKADKAFFHDAPGSAARRAYVIKGDTVIVTGGDPSWTKVRFNPFFEDNADTLGYLAGADLVALP